MRCSLLGYSFKPRPDTRPLDTMGSVKTVDFVLKRMPSLKNRFDEGKSRLSGPEVQAAAASIKGFARFRQSLIFSSSLKKTKDKRRLCWQGAHGSKKLQGIKDILIHTPYLQAI